MECNKDEAKRAMDIAERKVTEKDYNGAKKFANKAQNLYPYLDGLKQLLMTIDVCISGEKKIGGETDWYGVLGVDPLADEETVRKQYRKLALNLHPDKNKCKGAEGAFKLLSEAWSVLSDKGRRSSYNIKRQGKEVEQRFPATQSGIPPQHPASNGFQNVRVPSVKARTKPPVRSGMDSPAFVPVNLENDTFWTKCERCNTQYEYLRVYLNQTLLCPSCRQGFVAAEKTPPETVAKPVNLASNQQRRSSKNQGTNKKSYGTSVGGEPAPSASHGFGWDSVSKMAGANSRNATNQAADVVQQAQDKLKRGFGESQERDAARGFTNSDLRNFKKPRTGDTFDFGPFAPNPTGVGMGRFSTTFSPARGNTETPNTIGSRHPHIRGMLLPRDITKVVAKKARQDILKRLSEAEEKVKAIEREEKVKAIEKEEKVKAIEKEEKVKAIEREEKVKAIEKEEKVKAIEREKKSMKATGKENEVEISHDSDAEDDKVNIIIVPDSDFHNFDLYRSESSFEDDQIWAAYDDDDGMPRFYARIQKVISSNPFKMKISWLNSKSCSEFGEIDWIGSGFAKTCGDFRTGRYESTDTLNAFSHKVDFTKGARGILHILPRKGQVWALYRNWSPEWDKNTPDEVIHKYDMVEVVDDYTQEKQSVTVTLLLKAQGFKAVFRRSTDEKDVRKIPKEEMFRFSHQVPHCILTGNEGDNAPEGFLELDPAATPIDLLSENSEATKMDNEKNPIPVGMNLD